MAWKVLQTAAGAMFMLVAVALRASSDVIAATHRPPKSWCFRELPTCRCPSRCPSSSTPTQTRSCASSASQAAYRSCLRDCRHVPRWRQRPPRGHGPTRRLTRHVHSHRSPRVHRGLCVHLARPCPLEPAVIAKTKSPIPSSFLLYSFVYTSSITLNTCLHGYDWAAAQIRADIYSDNVSQSIQLTATLAGALSATRWILTDMASPKSKH